MCKEHIICPSDYTVSDWSGGQTTQLYIVPHGVNFKQRKFDFRISSATFTSTESEFSDFTGFQRYLFPLAGWLTVNHDGRGELRLEPYEVHRFSGSSKTLSRNSKDCKDFNFIVRDGLESNLTILKCKKEQEMVCAAKSTTCIYSADGFHTSIAINGAGTSHTNIRNEIPAGGLYVLESDEPCNIKIKPGKEPLVICQVIFVS